ncbi:MAG: hypothetical protein R3281_12715, partial [Balneolaceae bacterium]|nr:hypothetical protein [Balneolaceae bacterium]
MPEHREHNDPIEELFREKAGEFDIRYREEDWLKLENRLDKMDARRSRMRRWGWVAAACLLLFSL